MANVFIEESTMQAIGAAIRAKTGKEEGILPADMPMEIESIEAGDNFYDIFWDIYQDNGTRTNYDYAFAGTANWKNSIFEPKYWQALGDGTITSALNMFAAGRTSRIEYDLDFSNSTNCTGLFTQNIYVAYIKSIKFNNTLAANKRSNMFASTKYLVTIEEIKGVIDFDLVIGSCLNLDTDTLIRIVNALEDHGPNGLNDGVNHTLDLHADSIAKLQAVEDFDYIAFASQKGWSII